MPNTAIVEALVFLDNRRFTSIANCGSGYAYASATLVFLWPFGNNVVRTAGVEDTSIYTGRCRYEWLSAEWHERSMDDINVDGSKPLLSMPTRLLF
jgi:hypothetical protein